MQKIKLLLIPGRISALKEMITFSKQIDDCNCIFLLHPELLEHYNTNYSDGLINYIEDVDPISAIGNKRRVHPDKFSIAQKVLRRLFGSLWVSLKYYLLFIDILHFVERILNEETPDCLVLPGDRHIGYETAAVKIANKKNIPSIIISYGISSVNGVAHQRYIVHNHENIFGTKKLLAKFFPRVFPLWVFKYKGEKLFFLQPACLLGAWFAGIMPTNPWTLGGGEASRMAVESAFMRDQMIEQGTKESKIVITGRSSSDKLFQFTQNTEKKKKLRDLFGPKSGEKVILCSVPNHMEHRMLTPEKHFEGIRFLFSAMRQLENTKIILSLHPKSKYEDYSDLAKEYNFIIARNSIEELMFLCDFFVSGMSSTVLLAIASNKPVIAESFLVNINSGIYNNAPGVIVVNTRDEFIKILNRIRTDSEYHSKLKSDQIKYADYWMMLDGNCTMRIYKEIKNLI